LSKKLNLDKQDLKKSLNLNLIVLTQENVQSL